MTLEAQESGRVRQKKEIDTLQNRSPTKKKPEMTTTMREQCGKVCASGRPGSAGSGEDDVQVLMSTVSQSSGVTEKAAAAAAAAERDA